MTSRQAISRFREFYKRFTPEIMDAVVCVTGNDMGQWRVFCHVDGVKYSQVYPKDK